jgi:predicted 3-demethylubiquinone-9 3-methyltransferase (glyoxalase superfamily)
VLACAAAVLSSIAVTACSDDGDAGDPERFCGEVQENAEILTAPNIAAADDPEQAIDALLAEYRRIGEFAPLAIEAEWNQLVTAYEAADEMIAGDVESEQAALEAIFRAEEAAVAVAGWLRDNCGVDIGPVATIGGEPTTTADPATTDAP